MVPLRLGADQEGSAANGQTVTCTAAPSAMKHAIATLKTAVIAHPPPVSHGEAYLDYLSFPDSFRRNIFRRSSK